MTHAPPDGLMQSEKNSDICGCSPARPGRSLRRYAPASARRPGARPPPRPPLRPGYSPTKWSAHNGFWSGAFHRQVYMLPSPFGGGLGVRLSGGGRLTAYSPAKKTDFCGCQLPKTAPEFSHRSVSSCGRCEHFLNHGATGQNLERFKFQKGVDFFQKVVLQIFANDVVFSGKGLTIYFLRVLR